MYKAKDQSELNNIYAEWAATYDSDLKNDGWFGPDLVAGTLSKIQQDLNLYKSNEDKALLHILDVGAGTGKMFCFFFFQFIVYMFFCD